MNQTDLTGLIVEIIKERLSAGWELPLTVTVISANGCVMSGVYRQNDKCDGVDYEEHVNRAPAEGMELPIDVIVSKGGATIEVSLTRNGVGRALPFSKN